MEGLKQVKRGSTVRSGKDCRKWGALPRIQRTAGRGEHCRIYGGLLVAVGARRETRPPQSARYCEMEP